MRRNVAGEEARAAEEVCPQEIAEAAAIALEDHLVLGGDDLALATARVLGFEKRAFTFEPP